MIAIFPHFHRPRDNTGNTLQICRSGNCRGCGFWVYVGINWVSRTRTPSQRTGCSVFICSAQSQSERKLSIPCFMSMYYGKYLCRVWKFHLFIGRQQKRHELGEGVQRVKVMVVRVKLRQFLAWYNYMYKFIKFKAQGCRL